jgi:hypothetical protein
MPITLGDTTITGLGVGGLPAGTVNATTLASSAVTAAKIGYAGAILQVVNSVKTDTQTLSGLNTSWADISGISITITPRNASSKFIILSSISIGMSGNPAQYRIVRDGNPVLQGDAASNRKRGLIQYHDYQSAGIHAAGHFHSLLDTPNTTSAVTYKPQVSIGGGSTHYVNRTIRDIDQAAEDLRMASSMIVMEVAG